MQTPTLDLVDINGKPVRAGEGRRMLLSLFREATCPFCNFRIYDLTNNYSGLSEMGLDIVAVFRSDEQDVRQFIARRPRPFRMVADPAGIAHQAFAVSPSVPMGKLKAMLLRPLTMMRGMLMVGVRGMVTSNQMPADFLIDEHGNVIEAYYGNDIGDHIPMARVMQFAGTGHASKR